MIQTDHFRAFVEAIVSGDSSTAVRLLDASPVLAKERAAHGATRQGAKPNFFDRILHYIYEGDTALHMAAAAYQARIAAELIAKGADVRARNRRGAEPLHYAADGGPGSPNWNQVPRRRSLQHSFRLAPILMRPTKAVSRPLHRAVAIVALLP